MQDFKKLDVWRESFELAKKVYEITAKFPKQEDYGLTSQLRRAAVSISANIAEGTGRSTPADFNKFLYQSLGSAKETENLLMLSQELKLITLPTYNELQDQINHISKMLSSLIKKVKEGGEQNE